MAKNLLLFLSLFTFFIISCSDDVMHVSDLDVKLEKSVRDAAPDNSLDYWVLHNSKDLENIPQDPRNPLTPSKVELGNFLFFETGIALDNKFDAGKQTYSCSSCHIAEADFKPGRMQGIGDGGFGTGNVGETRLKHESYPGAADLDVQGIRPLTVLNVAYSAKNTQWNGSFGSGHANEGFEHRFSDDVDAGLALNNLGYEGLETQLQEGFSLHRFKMDPAIADSLGYIELFDAAFPDVPVEERYSPLNVALAMAAYLRTINTTEAPFQKWLKGDKYALTDQEKRGALLMFTKANCTSCHSGPAFSDTRFFAIGVNNLDELATFVDEPRALNKNFGRGFFTGNADDLHKFKVPTLYNLTGTPFYFHGSSKRSLREVVEYFNDAIPENPDVPTELIASNFKPLGMTESEIDDLTAFLANGLDDPTVERYKPSYLPSGLCFPNNDIVSRREHGCD
ncbi:cytochrome-c peroxidase [Membranihabitans marinus]|uniref:cytochrome-c peroxidase n=1 Tax=Membranihabitans marinus TaxID=1227546 RepID=UPI001F004964|nr:cytochrome c peroxidase [Membranihabitans marinus]